MRRTVAARPAARVTVEPATVALVVSGGLEQLYQARQWIWPLEELADSVHGPAGRPVQVIARDALVAIRLAKETRLPVVHARTTSQLGRALGDGALVALYPNQATLNFQALASPGPAHVHLSHGESEKISMVSNQLKAYDVVFTAGRAARDRIASHLIGFDASHCVDVGRPQLDEPRTRPADLRPSASRSTLYAPTWEGDSPEMSYSSLATAGVQVVESLLASGRRVIYRPHPQSGTRSARAREAHRRIVALLRQAGGDHVVDEGPTFGWQWDVADEIIVDLSAVAFDALTLGKPLVVYRPSAGAHLQPRGLLDAVVTYDRASAARIVNALREAASIEVLERYESLAEFHFGDTSHGASLSRFTGAVVATAEARGAALASQARHQGQQN